VQSLKLVTSYSQGFIWLPVFWLAH